MSAATLAPERVALDVPTPTRRRRFAPATMVRSAWFWLPLMLTGQAALAFRPGPNVTAFDDEGLYVYMGHRMIEHILHGTYLQESPGSYFSGAPGIYPVLAAMADSVGGLQAARGVSLAFAMVATIGTYGIGQQLFGKLAGLLGAAAFLLCGSVIFQSHLASFDSMTMGLVAVAGWLAVYSAKRDALIWAPAIGAILALAALTKYAGAVYAPMVLALAVTVGWDRFRWLIVRRAAFGLASAVAIFFFLIQMWGRDLLYGIAQTTSDRAVIRSAEPGLLIGQVFDWVGPWLVLAVVAALFRLRRDWATMAVLLTAAIIGPLQQIRIGEAVSLSKHVAFGMVFAAPLVGDLFARALKRKWQVAILPVAATLVAFGYSGVHFSSLFLTGWVDDRNLRTVLADVEAQSPGKPILGEQPSAMRYAMRKEFGPRQWHDTYSFSFGGKKGPEAYDLAIQSHYFGVIYLAVTTDNGSHVMGTLTAPDRDRYYHIVDKVPRVLRGVKVGDWVVFAPRYVPTAPGLNS